MAEAFEFQVITPERVVISMETSSLVVPGAEGYLGFLPDHAPMVVLLKPGVVKYKVGSEYRRMAVTGGFMEMANNKAVILADAAELAEEIDVMRARRALERARERLASRQEGIDFARARAALERAVARIRAAGEER